MNKKVTIQDIADALGISRNTVSKAINNSDGLAEATRDKILQKAIEMGYKQFSYVSTMANLTASRATINGDQPKYSGEIALFTPFYLPYNHFASLFLDKFHREISGLGFSLAIHRITRENLQTKTLPVSYNPERVAAIVCIEVFDKEYADILCNTDLPVLFVDGPARLKGETLNADMLLMNNMTEITRFVNLMLERGFKKIGFIGDYTHCQSFYERYTAFRLAMLMAGVPVDEKYIIPFKDRDVDTLADTLDALDELPDVFICSNDFSAIDAMQILAQRNRRNLHKVRFLGFDDTHESRIFYPTLSTVHIHTQAMAYSAMQLLMSRMQEPSIDYRSVHVATDLILRDSTEF